MAVVGLQTAIWSNRYKTVLLLFLFPALLFVVIFLVEYGNIYFQSTYASPYVPENFFQISLRAIPEVLQVFIYLGPALLAWALVSFYFHRQLIFTFSGARPIERKDFPELFNIVENLCISRGVPTPNIGILDDSSLNAFALGWNSKNAWIVFSQGIIDELDPAEIEAVAAHELTHILNKDGLLLVVTIVYIGAIAAIGELLLRSGSGNRKKGGAQLAILGLALMFLGYLVLPLTQLAISRKREYLADAGSVQLTKNKDAMVTALTKISKNSTIESVKKDTLSALCISNPFPPHGSSSLVSEMIHDFFSTHPSVEDRISMLHRY